MDSRRLGSREHALETGYLAAVTKPPAIRASEAAAPHASAPGTPACAGAGAPPPLLPVALRPRSFEAYRAAWRQAERLEVLPDFPLHLDIELASSCNLKC